MTRLFTQQCELTYEGAFVKPAFSLTDTPGRLCDLLLDALSAFGCTSGDLIFEEGEPSARGVTCDVDDVDAQVTLHGDRIEVHCASFSTATAAHLATMLENVWSRLAELEPPLVAKTHSCLFETDVQIRGASYQELLNRLAPVPELLPRGTETAIVYYLPGEPDRGHEESSLVLNRPAGVDSGLEVNATLVYEAGAIEPAAVISTAKNRFSELLRDLGLECVED